MIEREIGTNVVRAYRDALPGSLLAPRSAGIPTDDTAMTLALVDALVVPGSRTPRELLSCMVSALQRGSGRFSAMFWNGGPGGACIAMMRAAQGGAAPFEGLNPQAGGNGAAMRAHPCGAFADRAFVADLSAMQARLSHPHPGAVASAQVVALVVHEAIYEGRLATAVPPEITDRSMLAAWERAHEGLERGPRLPPHLLDADMAGWNTVATRTRSRSSMPTSPTLRSAWPPHPVAIPTRSLLSSAACSAHSTGRRCYRPTGSQDSKGEPSSKTPLKRCTARLARQPRRSFRTHKISSAKPRRRFPCLSI
jgi:hypothetical protein